MVRIRLQIGVLLVNVRDRPLCVTGFRLALVKWLVALLLAEWLTPHKTAAIRAAARFQLVCFVSRPISA